MSSARYSADWLLRGFSLLVGVVTVSKALDKLNDKKHPGM